jgi:hypothetical protein
VNQIQHQGIGNRGNNAAMDSSVVTLKSLSKRQFAPSSLFGVLDDKSKTITVIWPTGEAAFMRGDQHNV